MKKPLGLKILIALNLFLALGAIPTGVIFLADPSGKLLGIQTLLPKLSFLNDFSLVGLWLIAIYGALPLTLSTALWKQKRWAWIATLALGFVEVAWILSETVILGGFTILYPLYGIVGLLTIAVSLLPSVKSYFDGSRRLKEQVEALHVH